MSDVSELMRAIHPVDVGAVRATDTKSTAQVAGEFTKLLREEQGRLQFSSHAETRIKSRSIPWSAELETRIAGGIDQAKSKGSREALILADNVAVIANVKSRTVITAMERSQMKEKIFTNIDSAVLV